MTIPAESDAYALPARDGLADVRGLRIGHWTDCAAATGCSVVLCPPGGAVAASAVLGGAPGTREIEVTTPGNLVERVHAVLLTGGSAFGLDAATGVMQELERRGAGYKMPTARVPIVVGAVIYDLGLGRADVRPGAAEGRVALRAARSRNRACGTIGAGTGATVAKLNGLHRAVKGGLGTAAEWLSDGTVVGALAVVNAVGEVVRPEDGVVIAGPRGPENEFLSSLDILRRRREREIPAMENTTIAVVATDASLDRDALRRVALMAHAGIARTVRPSHTPADGDTVIALATATGPAAKADILAIGALAARAMERAMLRGVLAATGLYGVPSSRELRDVAPTDRRNKRSRGRVN